MSLLASSAAGIHGKSGGQFMGIVSRRNSRHNYGMSRPVALFALTLLAMIFGRPAQARILWSDPSARAVHSTGAGVDILGGAVKRTSTNDDALYFKFKVDPISDVHSEPYFAGFQLFEGDDERLGVGNALEAWAYSAFKTAETGPSNSVAGEFNFKSTHPEPEKPGVSLPYELVHQGIPRTILFKIQYVPGADDLVTVWLEPNLGRGASENNQPEQITTKFKANATFDQIRLRHGKGDKGDGGNGWIFSDMAIATAFDDFVVVHYWQTWWFNTLVAVAVLVAVSATVRLVEKKKFQQRLRRIEQESALERERSRIAQDLHDDLGSSLTRISLLSELVRADKHNPAQVDLHAGKLSQSASQTVRALEEIVWAVRPGSDTLQSLVDYITHFAGEVFEGSPTRCRLASAGRTAGAHPAAGRAPQHLLDRQGNADQHLETRRCQRSSLADQSGAKHLGNHHQRQWPGIRRGRRHRHRQTQRPRQHAPSRPSRGRPPDPDQCARHGDTHGVFRWFSRLTWRAGRLCFGNPPSL